MGGSSVQLEIKKMWEKKCIHYFIILGFLYIFYIYKAPKQTMYEKLILVVFQQVFSTRFLQSNAVVSCSVGIPLLDQAAFLQRSWIQSHISDAAEGHRWRPLCIQRIHRDRLQVCGVIPGKTRPSRFQMLHMTTRKRRCIDRGKLYLMQMIYFLPSQLMAKFQLEESYM